MRGPAPHPESPFGATTTPPGVRAVRSPLPRGWRLLLPCLLYVLALLFIACPALPDAGPLGAAPSLTGLNAFEAGDGRAPDDVPRMAHLTYDADDLREAFAAPNPRVSPVAMAIAAFVPAGADRPDAREDHPPDRPPRSIV